MTIFSDDAGDDEEGSGSAEPTQQDIALATAGYSPTAEKIKFVIGKILKFATIGGVVGGLALGGAAVAATISLGGAVLGTGGAVLGAGGKVLPALAMAGPWGAGVAAIATIGLGIASAIGLWNAGAIGGMLLGGLGTAALAGVVVGVVAGAVLGAVFGFSGMDEAAGDKADELVAISERKQMREQNHAMIKQQLRAQQLALTQQEHELGIHHGGSVAMPFRPGGRKSMQIS